ncbi:twin-arginine translocation signal domain-containing protein [Streptomyces palmae]|uniref:Twin-arginine translocation signal domain-containing protein n=1 Tax=Streptomyces palmae TaxID=1701085 RepID=A0A4Z0G3S5_9ACTN|nr:twin-arginine translocation signal domain-containing protein [Streptomyces palmae]
MSGISRRSLLGYSGTAAAGAVLTSAGSAQADEGAEHAEDKKAGGTGSGESVATAAGNTFPMNTVFRARASLPNGVDGELGITFSVEMMDTPAGHEVPPIEIANALSKIVESHGWQPITFYGTPAPVPLTS